MKERLFLQKKHKNRTMLRRWCVVVVALLVQVVIIGILMITSIHTNHPDVTLVPVPGQPDICRITNVAPFSEAWRNAIHTGTVIYPTHPDAGQQPPLADCQLNRDVDVATTPNGTPFKLHASGPPISTQDILLAGLLALIFELAGIAIFFRAQQRPTARVTYALFYCVSMLSSLFGTMSFNIQWNNLLILNLQIMISGLSTTFVCLFSYPNTTQSLPGTWSRRSAYLPLLVGIGLVVLNSLALTHVTQHAQFFPIATFLYNIVCVLIIIGTLIWGLRNVRRNEQPLARMVMIGVIFLLTISSLSLGIIPPMPFFHGSILHLVPIPLVILPIICDYMLFRHQLLGKSSLLSRTVMRVFLWTLLACLFILPAIILLRAVTGNDNTIRLEWRDYLYAALMALSFWLFPFVWNKVRDVGDHVLYHDFYQYNEELRQLSTALTGLRNLDQISAFILPRLEQLLNANEVALFIRATSQDEMQYMSNQSQDTRQWHLYRYSMEQAAYSDDHLRRIADLALMHFCQRSFEPLLLDDVLLLSLYDGDLITGLLCLGSKQNYEPYSRQDKSFLSSLVAQLSILEVNNRYLTQARADAQKVTALNHRVISAQEEERRHLALDLHDDVLQEAMLLVRQLSDVDNIVDVADTLPLARSVVTNLRRTCLALRPSLLEDLGLAEALRWLARQTEQMENGKLQVIAYCIGYDETHHGTPVDGVELAFYRVAQEALANVLKHAQASRVIMRLRYGPTTGISLIIADNGQGFRLGDPHHESLGIIGMHERMSSIGGTISVRTAPGRGAVIRASYQSTGISIPMRSQTRQYQHAQQEELTH
ncbi:sensor histidine kinase [Dictyobacter arantiisoli]|uniref:histidine kinase n=1 Tax=Dictyobacter arantiisoli TaxID=2014874 RepID=A0A5A5T7G1_9CHLR|nr:ATP-binding protein [Dictyobacter arantiisoli]GCF07195.1 hypothetical protein KDI_07590 [Dictyobacter arantiisoli]